MILDLGLINQYFHDRLQELNNQVGNGDPFVFLGAFSLVNTLVNLTHVDTVAEAIGLTREQLQDVQTAGERLFTRFTIKPTNDKPGISLSHVEPHLSLTNTSKKTVLNAQAFLDSLSEAVETIFRAADKDSTLSGQIFAGVNEGNVLVGYGGD